MELSLENIGKVFEDQRDEWLEIVERNSQSVDYNNETVDIYIYLDTVKHLNKVLDTTAQLVTICHDLEKETLNLMENQLKLLETIRGYKNTLVLLRANAHTQN